MSIRLILGRLLKIWRFLGSTRTKQTLYFYVVSLEVYSSRLYKFSIILFLYEVLRRGIFCAKKNSLEISEFLSRGIFCAKEAISPMSDLSPKYVIEDAM